MTTKVIIKDIARNPPPNACFCMGPQGGEPLCPCQMRLQGIFERDGQWIRPAQPEEVIGPVKALDTVIPASKMVWMSGKELFGED